MVYEMMTDGAKKKIEQGQQGGTSHAIFYQGGSQCERD